MERKKIIIVNNMLGYYGAENVLINMVNHLEQKKYDVTVLTLIESDSSRLNLGIKYKYIFKKDGSFFTRLGNKIKLCLNYKRLARIYCKGFDIAIAFKMGESAKIVGFSDAHQKYCWIHSNVTEIGEKHSYSFKSLEEENAFLTRFDELVAVSNACAESFLKKYQGCHNVRVIYNPVDANDILRKADEQLSNAEMEIFEDDVPILGTVARIDSQKRIDRLIHISEKMMNEGLEHKLIIIGDGIDYHKIKTEILQKKMRNIYMIGFRNNPYKYVKRFDLFLCSSQRESYSIVVNEALVLGIPVISTKCGGPEEVLHYGKYGILTENSEEALYAAVKKYLLEGAKEIEKYRAEFSITNFLDNLDDLFGGK